MLQGGVNRKLSANRSTEGSLGFTGVIGSTFSLITQAVSGALSFSGVTAKKLLSNRLISGELSFNGSLGESRVFYRLAQGVLSLSGNVVGNLAGLTKVLVQGILTFSGALSDTNFYSRLIQGTIGFKGKLSGKLNGETIGSLIKMFRWYIARRFKL